MQKFVILAADFLLALLMLKLAIETVTIIILGYCLFFVFSSWFVFNRVAQVWCIKLLNQEWANYGLRALTEI